MELITNNLRFNKRQKYFCFDLETENLNLLFENRPWQVGWLLSEGEDVIKSCGYYLKWPNLKVSKGAAIATRFDPVKVNEEGKDPRLVLEAFEKYLLNPEYKIVFFNGLMFDVYNHGIWRKSLGLEPNHDLYINRGIDVHALIKAYKLEVPLRESDDFLMWQYRLLNYHAKGVRTNLTQSCKDLGIDVDGKKMHDAKIDIVQTFLVFLELLKKFNII